MTEVASGFAFGCGPTGRSVIYVSRWTLTKQEKAIIDAKHKNLNPPDFCKSESLQLIRLTRNQFGYTNFRADL
jgi:hypothetical protein